jgi:hypothetical protein
VKHLQLGGVCRKSCVVAWPCSISEEQSSIHALDKAHLREGLPENETNRGEIIAKTEHNPYYTSSVTKLAGATLVLRLDTPLDTLCQELGFEVNYQPHQFEQEWL